MPTQLCQEGRAGRAMRACKFGQNILIPPPHSGPAIVADLAEVDILTEKDAGFKHINTAVFKGFLDRKPGTILLERCFARFCQLRHILLKCPDIEVLGRRRGTFRKYFAITPPPSSPPPGWRKSREENLHGFRLEKFLQCFCESRARLEQCDQCQCEASSRGRGSLTGTHHIPHHHMDIFCKHLSCFPITFHILTVKE